MGWQEGEGLGKEKQGITEHVRVSKKKDNSGVGIDAQQKAASNWTFNTTTFDSILKNLNVIVADTSQEGDNDKQNETVAHDLKLTKSLPLTKVTRPQGRYKKRELGKVLQGKSQVDLDAILGFGNKPPRQVWPVFDATIKESLSEPSCVPPERLAEVNDATSALHPPAVIKAKQPLEEMPVVNIASDWWGTKYGFVRAGAPWCDAKDRKTMAGLEANQSTKTRTSFCEQDQEDLYKLVQDKATKGRQGLGIADRPKKVGGANWKGKKVILDNSDEDAESEEVLDVEEKGTGITVDVICETDVSKRKADSEGGEDTRNRKKPRQDYKFKWKKLCRRLLQEAPAETMKIKDLLRLIVEESYLYTGGNSDASKQPVSLCKEKIKEKLIKSSRFVIEGKKVSLAISS